MYFPYLRGRQFELIALRELVENSLLSDKIIPIIEPVKLSSTLIKTIQIFNENSKMLAIIHNPKVGDFKSDMQNEKNLRTKEKYLELIKSENIVETHILNSCSDEYISKLSKRGKPISEIITIFKDQDTIPIYEELFSPEKPRYNLIPDESIYRRSIRHQRVMMDNKFKKLTRNTDYAEINDEPFSTDHLFYDEDGYVGFSDYSIIGNEYSDTGFAPYAIAIHIVYFDKDYKLRIKHFVSDTNDDITDPAGKFAEALKKLITWNREQKLDTLAIRSFTQMYQSEIYPGLGTAKKLSIMHHIELVGKYLDWENRL
ncbi:MAG: sce7725 family protein [Ruminiclostridium sp.]